MSTYRIGRYNAHNWAIWAWREAKEAVGSRKASEAGWSHQPIAYFPSLKHAATHLLDLEAAHTNPQDAASILSGLEAALQRTLAEVRRVDQEGAAKPLSA